MNFEKGNQDVWNQQVTWKKEEEHKDLHYSILSFPFHGLSAAEDEQRGKKMKTRPPCARSSLFYRAWVIIEQSVEEEEERLGRIQARTQPRSQAIRAPLFFPPTFLDFVYYYHYYFPAQLLRQRQQLLLRLTRRRTWAPLTITRLNIRASKIHRSANFM